MIRPDIARVEYEPPKANFMELNERKQKLSEHIPRRVERGIFRNSVGISEWIPEPGSAFRMQISEYLLKFRNENLQKKCTVKIYIPNHG